MTVNTEVLIAVGIVMATVVVLAVLGWSTRIGKDGIHTVKEGGQKKKVSPHINCPHRMSGMAACRKSYSFGFSRGVHKFEIISQQMAVYDEFEEESISTLKNEFLKMLKSKAPEHQHYSLHSEYLNFETMLTSVFNDLSMKVRRWVKNNHYAQKDATEQTEYIKKKRTVILQSVDMMFDRWWTGVLVDKEMLREHIEENEQEWSERITTLFVNLFSIARESNDNKKESEDAFVSYMEETFGEKVQVTDETIVL